MATIAPVGLLVNTTSRTIVSATGSSSPLTSLTLRRGDTHPLDVYFFLISAGVVNDPLTSFGTLKFAGKTNADWDGPEVISISQFTTTYATASASTFYRATLDLSGTTLNNLFAATNTAQVTLHAELEWQDRLFGVTYRTSTPRFNIIVQNDINKN